MILSKKIFNITQIGQGLLELVVVLGVSVIVISALTYATIISLRNAQFANNQSQATKLAQEAIERVRSARDRDLDISYAPNVDSWNGLVPPHNKPIWNFKVFNDSCNAFGNSCFFRFLNSQGDLAYVGTDPADSINPPNGLEDVYGNGIFRRGVIIQDNSSTYQTQKTVIAVVYWTDATGTHHSTLTTILTKMF